VRELVGRPAAAPASTVVAAAPAAAPKEPAKPAPVVEKPKPAPEKPAADPSAEVLKAVNAWAEAWSKKDADAYLAHYARNFDPPGKESRSEWEKTRRARVTAPKSISVTLDSPKVTMNGADRATVTFRQNYRSDLLKSTSRKTLVLVRAEGGWKILEEKSG
jgi:ketosteroid isomerase-like protein